MRLGGEAARFLLHFVASMRSALPLSSARRGQRRPGRAIVAAVAAAGLCLALAPSAFAHAAFLEAKPAPGSRVGSPPGEIALRFTEPLNRRLTKVAVVAIASGRQVPGSAASGKGRAVAFRPARRLAKGAYRIDWHTVSTQDGHALEGSFSFGVGVAATGSAHDVEQSPLARAGWLRILVRALFYAALLFFAGGVLNAVLLARPGPPGAWLAPEQVQGEAPRSPGTVAWSERAWTRTLDAGWLAAGAAVAVAIVEAADAGGGLRPSGLSDFLLSNVAGWGRVATVVAVAAAVPGARRRPRLAVGWLGLAFLAIALSGHANSAEHRTLAVLTDWVHLIAAALWLGGIAQIAATWLSAARHGSAALRHELMRSVLSRFGTVALPAFLIVAGTGIANALIELGGPTALWQTPYGRVLAAKIALVGLIAVASCWHALRLRPRLLAAKPHPPPKLERRHWRLLGSEPAIGLFVVVAAALLVAFPLPPRQARASEGAERALSAQAACNPCPLQKPRADELGVAEQAGSSIVAGWFRRRPGGLTGTVRVLDYRLKPVGHGKALGAAARSCGPGCMRLSIRGRPREMAVEVPEGGRTYTAHLPLRWRSGENRRARELLERTQGIMGGLSAVREDERVTSGPASFARVRYRLQAPRGFAYRTDRGAESIVIGRWQWSRSGPGARWEKTRFGGGGPGFRFGSWFRWTAYAQSVRLLDTGRRGTGRFAEIAVMDEATPVWLRLWIDRDRMRVVRARMIARGHFMTQRYSGFNRSLRIEAPGGR